MKRYNTDKMLEAWSTVSSLSSTDPYPASVMDGEDPEDLLNQGDSDMVTNVPSIDGYDVNKSIHRKSSKLKITEAEEEEIPTQGPAPQPNPQSQPVPPDMQTPQGMDPSMMQDPNAAGGYQDPSMIGMGMGMEGPTSTFDVGRVYELKKIYSRLVSMQSYLAGTTDPNLIKLRNYVAGSMDLFRTLISNIALYKDRLDEIIIVFYKVVDNVYSILSKYYKDKDSGKMVQAIENSLYNGNVNEGQVKDWVGLKYSQYKSKKAAKNFTDYLDAGKDSPCAKYGKDDPRCQTHREKHIKKHGQNKGQILLDKARKETDANRLKQLKYDLKYKTSKMN